MLNGTINDNAKYEYFIAQSVLYSVSILTHSDDEIVNLDEDAPR